MEVSSIGQGGQFNYTNKSAEVIENNSLPSDKTEKDVIQIDAQKGSEDANPKEDDIKKAVEKLNRFLEDEDTYAEYAVHDKFKDVMIKIINSKTKEVVLEIPPKKILDMVAKMCEMVGVLLDEKA